MAVVLRGERIVVERTMFRILLKDLACYGIKALLYKGDIAAYFSWLFYPLLPFPNFPIPDPYHTLHSPIDPFR